MRLSKPFNFRLKDLSKNAFSLFTTPNDKLLILSKSRKEYYFSTVCSGFEYYGDETYCYCSYGKNNWDIKLYEKPSHYGNYSQQPSWYVFLLNEALEKSLHEHIRRSYLFKLFYEWRYNEFIKFKIHKDWRIKTLLNCVKNRTAYNSLEELHDTVFQNHAWKTQEQLEKYRLANGGTLQFLMPTDGWSDCRKFKIYSCEQKVEIKINRTICWLIFKLQNTEKKDDTIDVRKRYEITRGNAESVKAKYENVGFVILDATICAKNDIDISLLESLNVGIESTKIEKYTSAEDNLFFRIKTNKKT